MKASRTQRRSPVEHSPIERSPSGGLFGRKMNSFLTGVLVLGICGRGSSFAPSTSKSILLDRSSRRTVVPMEVTAPGFRSHRAVIMRDHKGSLRGTKNDGDREDTSGSSSPEAPSSFLDAPGERGEGPKKNDNSAVAMLSSIGEAIAKATNAVFSNHAALAVAFLLSLAVLLAPLPSLAVGSGGRMGGSFGSSGRSSNGGTYSAPSYGRGYNRGFGSGYYSRPSVVVSPPVVAAPYYSPFTPFYSPFWSPRPAGVVVSTGPSIFGIFGLFAVATVALSVFAGAFGNAGRSAMDAAGAAVGSALGPGISVARLSVALEVPNRDDPNSILSVLDRLSDTARTDSRVGIQNLTSQVALELLRRKQSIVSGSSTYSHFRDNNKASREFNKLAVKERGKFERETVSKYGGVDYGQSRERQTDLTQYSAKATMAVVTIILAIEGDSTKLPQIRSQGDVEDALGRIASDAKVDSCLQSAEILWTPEERSETLTMRDVLSDYPSLRTI